MESVTEPTMAIESTFSSILNGIQLSKLNFTDQLTPYTAYITLKKSTQVDTNGVPAVPSPPVFLLLQQSLRDLYAAQEENAHLRLALNKSEKEREDVLTVNDSLLKKLETVDTALAFSQETNENLVSKLECKDKEILKLMTTKKDIENKSKVQKADYDSDIKAADLQIKSLHKLIKSKDKEIQLSRNLLNAQEKLNNQKAELSKLKDSESKLQRSLKKMEKKM